MENEAVANKDGMRSAKSSVCAFANAIIPIEVIEQKLNLPTILSWENPGWHFV